ncbi:BCCT family transporter [Rapidithrix thailandica]|uniref:BCCT family transporter n=1 Tax=Rapidithrix thailandica TaxID=413964 RepID=A0AAW9SHD1_9BACT
MGIRHTRSDEKTFLGIKANGPVFITSLLVIFILVITTLLVGQPMELWFKDAKRIVSNNLGWLFILLVNVILLFTLYLGFSKYGNIRLGGEQAQPEFSKGGWFAMLFSAGMGIGLLFYSVAEPITHFGDNPLANNDIAIEAAKSSMGITFLHWGVHAWAIYAIVGLALAFFTFNIKLPLTIRSIFYPLFGNKIYGWVGDVIDIVSVIATIFGLATSLGIGVQQINAGLHHLFGIQNSNFVQLALIVIVTSIATLSLILGLDKGIRILSEWNMRLALLLMLLVIVIGPTVFLFKSFVQNIGHYISEFFELSFWTESYKGINKEKHWQNTWTVFYWAWWIAWSPFVGLFIARISKGRTIREFIFGVLLVPTLLTFLWISVFGGTAIYQELTHSANLIKAVNSDIATAIYKMLEHLPFSFYTSLLTVILVTSFFVTSSDSGSMVVDTLTSGGRHDAPVGQKIFWASMEGIVAGTLLVGGGLVALQTAVILTGLPFAIILVVMCFSLYKSLQDYYEERIQKKQKQPTA